MQVIAEIFSQGEDVVSGQTVDTNATWLSEKLVHMGFTVKRHLLTHNYKSNSSSLRAI